MTGERWHHLKTSKGNLTHRKEFYLHSFQNMSENILYCREEEGLLVQELFE